MEIRKIIPPNIVTEETIFIKDKPNVYRNDGPCKVQIDVKKCTGTFNGPARLFDAPQRGDLFDVKMRSGNVLRCVVTKCEQDYIRCYGDLVMLTYAEKYQDYLRMGWIENEKIKPNGNS